MEKELLEIIEKMIVNKIDTVNVYILAACNVRPMNMTDLAAKCNISTAAMTMRIDKLAENGLVRRIDSDDDRRVKHVVTSHRGGQALRRVTGRKEVA